MTSSTPQQTQTNKLKTKGLSPYWELTRCTGVEFKKEKTSMIVGPKALKKNLYLKPKGGFQEGCHFA